MKPLSITQALIMSPASSATLQVAATTLGRDKAYRAIQYFARFYAHWLATRGYSPETVARWIALKNALSQSRKLMRVGKWLEHLQNAFKAATLGDPILRLSAIGRQIGYALYLMADTLQWLHMVKVKTFTPIVYDRLSRLAARFWLIGISFSLVSGVYKRNKLHNQIANVAISSVSSEKEIERRAEIRNFKTQLSSTNTQLLQDVLDWWLPAGILGYHSFSEGTLGILGLVTSIMGLRTQTANVFAGKV